MGDSPLAKKLLIKPGSRVVLAGAPEGFKDLLDGLPEGARLSTRFSGGNEVVLLFAASGQDFAKHISKAVLALKPGGVLWVAYPKQSGKIKTDLNRDILRAQADATGLKAVSLVSLDATWSAMRLKPQ